MGSGQDRKMIVGLDIGTSKVVVIVGEIGGDGTIEVVGIGSAVARSQARRRGQHRVNSAVDPACGRGSGTDGRL